MVADTVIQVTESLGLGGYTVATMLKDITLLLVGASVGAVLVLGTILITNPQAAGMAYALKKLMAKRIAFMRSSQMVSMMKATSGRR